jgi:paraquat-inducible protein A
LTAPVLIACHECDLLQRAQPVPVGATALCSRCGTELYRHRPNSLDRTLALTLAGLILFIVANASPLLAFKMQGQVTETTLLTGIQDLYLQGKAAVAAVVLFTCVLAPGLQLVGLLYVLLPIKFNCSVWKLAPVYRAVRTLQPWGMMEVFMLGVLVSFTKLSGMAKLVPGLALWALALLIVVLAAVAAALDPRVVWERVEVR